MVKSATRETLRIGLFGGSFDPIHFCHLEMAKYARDKFSLDQIHFIVTSVSPFKVNNKSLSAEKRFEIVSKAIESSKNFYASDFEIKQGEISYSYKTVSYFKELFPQSKLFWISGFDAFSKLKEWNNYDYLRDNLEFIVFSRNQDQHSSVVMDKKLHYNLIKDFNCQVSSSYIRENLQSANLANMLSSNTVDLIKEYYLPLI